MTLVPKAAGGHPWPAVLFGIMRRRKEKPNPIQAREVLGRRAPGWIRATAVYVRHQWPRLLLTLLAAILATAGLTLRPLPQKVVIESAILQHQKPLWPLIGVLIGLPGLSFGAAFVWRYKGGKVNLSVPRRLRNRIFDHVQRLDGAAESRLQNGQLIARCSSDLMMVQQLVSWVPLAFGRVIMVCLSMAVMVALSPPLALLVARVVMLRLPARLSSTVQAIPVVGQVPVLLAGGLLVLQGRTTAHGWVDRTVRVVGRAVVADSPAPPVEGSRVRPDASSGWSSSDGCR